MEGNEEGGGRGLKGREGRRVGVEWRRRKG
jgi:hypothetical protein